MARLWSSGFELNSAVSGTEWTTVTNGTVQSTTKRSGGFAGQVTSLASGVARGFGYQWIAAGAAGPWFARCYCRFDTLPSAENTFFALFESAGFATGAIAAQISIDNTGALRLYYRDHNTTTKTQVGSASSALSTGVWYRIEMWFDGSPAAGSNVIKASIDGTNFASSSTVNLDNPLVFCIGGNLAAEAQTAGNFFFDDAAINDSTGAAQTGMPGAGSIVHMQPDSAGDNAAWTAGVGGTANWNRVSEVSPDDATTYNQKTTTGTVIDDHNCVSSSSAGIGASDTITLVQVGLRGGSTGTTSGATVTPRLKSQASGTLAAGAVAGAFNVNGWRTNDATPANYRLTSYTDPQAGGAWTPTLLSAMQIGYTNAASNTTVRRISTVWALVEYVPSGGATDAIVPASISATSSMSGAVTKLALVKGGTVNATSAVSGTVAKQALVTPASIQATSTVSGSVVKLAHINPASITATSTISGTVVRLAAITGGTIQATSAVTGTVTGGSTVRHPSQLLLGVG